MLSLCRIGATGQIGGRVMGEKDIRKKDEDKHAVWERPAFRRLLTKDAESAGGFQDEGIGVPQCKVDGCMCHSCQVL